ncbi:hypothetical protein B0H10DRAFT_1947466 [Mycena sp. CBHHK59/15]|nr:hypothetical protein B0H10DRAFT_1947466 [Mycena sp. CBHHK59/15]
MRSEQGKKKEEGQQDDGDAGRTCKFLVLCARVRPTVMSLVDGVGGKECLVASSFTALGNAHADARQAEAKGHSTTSTEGYEHACTSGRGYDTLEVTGWLQNTSDGYVKGSSAEEAAACLRRPPPHASINSISQHICSKRRRKRNSTKGRKSHMRVNINRNKCARTKTFLQWKTELS